MSEEGFRAPRKAIPVLNLAFTAISTALVCAATMFFTVYVPATKGFFNIGESMVFLSAILFGPFTGAFAGGVGSMLADLLLGYPHYAPATLVIKACEGFIVGILSRRNPKLGRLKWKVMTFALGLAIGLLLAVIGSMYYSGRVELTLGQMTLALHVPEALWITLGAIATVSIALAGLLADPETGWLILSILAGGLTMVLGYFIYQAYFIFPLFGIEAYAIAEVPVNIGQMTIGLVIALPISKIIKGQFAKQMPT